MQVYPLSFAPCISVVREKPTWEQLLSINGELQSFLPFARIFNTRLTNSLRRFDSQATPGMMPGAKLVEAAGQLFHIFRYGLDYSFTCTPG